MKKSRFLIMALCIIGFGILLRFLSRGVPDAAVDQAIALYFAKFGYLEMWQQLYRAEIHPWGFYAVLRFFAEAVGFRAGHGPVVSAVLLWQVGTVAYVLSAAVLYQIVARLGGPRWTRLALVFVLSVHVVFVDRSVELRTYPWLLLTLLTSMFFAMRAHAVPSWTRFGAWGISLGLAFQFHYGAILAAIPQFFYLSVTRREFCKPFVGAGLSFLVALPSLLFLTRAEKLSRLQPLEYAQVFNFETLRNYFFATLWPGVSVDALAPGFAACVVVCALILLFRKGLTIPLVGLQVAVPLLFLSVTGMMSSPTFIDRYYVFLTLNLLLLALLPMTLGGWRRRVEALLAATIVLSAGYSTITVPLRWEKVNLSLKTATVFPSARLRDLARQAGPHFRDALCAGQAAISDDYFAAELLLHFCPETFGRLTRLNTQVFPPSEEWYDRRSPPQIIGYLNDTPSRHLHGNGENFFRKHAKFQTRVYRRLDWGEATFWIRSPKSESPDMG